jgi:hypothetical protein
VRSQAVSTVKKSQAVMPPICARRNSVQVGQHASGRDRAAQSGGGSGSSSRRRGSRACAAHPDAHTVPARVLPGEPEDQLRNLGIDPWPAWTIGPAERPLPPYEIAVPPQRGRRRDGECDPAVPRHRPTGRCEEDAVTCPELRPADLPLEHSQLVAQDEDLEVLAPWSRPRWPPLTTRRTRARRTR